MDGLDRTGCSHLDVRVGLLIEFLVVSIWRACTRRTSLGGLGSFLGSDFFSSEESTTGASRPTHSMLVAGFMQIGLGWGA